MNELNLPPGMKPILVVEAALFSAGRSITVDEIMDATGLKRAQVEKAVKELAAVYAERDTVLEVGKAGKGWGMQVRTIAAEPAARFAQMEIPAKTLKTLALIAYHQPIKQSELSDMIGSKVYDHIPALKELCLVNTRRDGQTKILSVTSRFPEYFGLDAASPVEIRALMAKLVGMDAKASKKSKPKKEKDLGSFQQAPAVDANPDKPEESATQAPAPHQS